MVDRNAIIRQFTRLKASLRIMLFHWPIWRHHWRQSLHHMLPSSCVLCGVIDHDALCDACHAQYFIKLRHRCRRCAAALPDQAAGECGTCLRQIPAFNRTIVATDYAAPADQLVLALKFGGRLAIAPLFARLLRDVLSQEPLDAANLPTLMTAVPLGAQRLKERGFNQALEIAKPLSELLGMTLAPRLIERLRDTRAQAQLHSSERRANMRSAFIVPSRAAAMVHGQHVCVVDDVITTGETLHEVAATLKRSGAVRVTNLVVSRTPTQ